MHCRAASALSACEGDTCFFWLSHSGHVYYVVMGHSLLASYHRSCPRLMQIAQQEEESKADDEGLQMVLKRLKALEQENDGPERRELLRRRKKQLKEILSQHKEGSQLPALQKRFEQEVQWPAYPLCSGFMHAGSAQLNGSTNRS